MQSYSIANNQMGVRTWNLVTGVALCWPMEKQNGQQISVCAGACDGVCVVLLVQINPNFSQCPCSYFSGRGMEYA